MGESVENNKAGPRAAPVVAIDGPSGTGKSTVARLVAARLEFRHADTGAMYRALALGAKQAGVDIESDKELGDYCSKLSLDFEDDFKRILINGKDLTEQVREPFVGPLTSKVSARRPVREFLMALQREIGRHGAIVMEGRDIGTAVFPDAEVKIYLDASENIRARRRHRENLSSKAAHGGKLRDVQREIEKRDRMDSRRELSPLKRAPDALYIDTSKLSINEVVKKVMQACKKRFGD